MPTELLFMKAYLFTGLVVHKAVWEYLRTRDAGHVEDRSGGVGIIKFIKIVILAGILVQVWLPDVFPIMSDAGPLRVVGTVVFTIGLAAAIAARVQLGKNWSNIESGRVLAGQEVVERGVYRYIRHPIYTGDLLLLAGLEMALNSWLLVGVLVLAPAVFLKAVAEEKLLERSLAGYSAYTQRTKRFIPFVI